MFETVERQDNRFAFRIRDRESCEAAIRNGGRAAMISASITALFATIGLLAGTSGKEQEPYFDPWALVDAGLVALLGFFVFRRSRAASTLMFGYFLLSKLLIMSETGSPAGLPLAIIFLVFYFNAMRGTYIWHRTYRSALAQTVA